MRRIGVTVMVAVAMAASISACGSSASGQITSTIKSFLTALANGDSATACADLTSGARSSLVSEAAGSGDNSCAAVVKAFPGALTKAQKSKLLNASVSSVSVSGNSATAGLKGGTGKADLSKVGGKWLISGGLSS